MIYTDTRDYGLPSHDFTGCSHNPMSRKFDLNTLNEHVVHNVTADWNRLGLSLGVKARVLDTVLADLGRDSTKACIVLLGKWLNGAVGTGQKQREWSTVLEAVGEAIGTEVQRYISDNLGTLKLYISNLLFFKFFLYV